MTEKCPIDRILIQTVKRKCLFLDKFSHWMHFELSFLSTFGASNDKNVIKMTCPFLLKNLITANRKEFVIWWLLMVWYTWHHAIGYLNIVQIDPPHKSHDTPVPYPTLHHVVTEMCTCVHISVTKWCIVGYLSDALWDLWDGSIGPFDGSIEM